MSNQTSPSVLLASIDALKPELVLRSEEIGLAVPHLRHFLEHGTYASRGVKSVFPTFTYPCHQSIITGTYPSTHGIHTNKLYDPEGIYQDAWYWYVSDFVPNLWECAKSGGYLSVNVAFPSSVGARADYNIPEFWRDGTALDSRLIDAVSHPQGIVKEIEKGISAIFPGGLDLSLDADSRRQAAALWMMKNKIEPEIATKPFFMTAYFASYDDTAHIYGVHSGEALKTLEAIDTLLGQLMDEAYRISGGNIVVCVISDHGLIDNIADIRPNTLFYHAGLIRTNQDGKITDWEAWCQRSGGSAQIKLKDPQSDAVHRKVRTILDRLLNDPDSGVMKVLTRKETVVRKGFPEADYVIVSKPGYEIREDIIGEYYSPTVFQKAQHGYAEELSDMRASFYMEGINIPAKNDIGELDLIDIAPTLAHIMGFSMPSAEGKDRFPALD